MNLKRFFQISRLGTLCGRKPWKTSRHSAAEVPFEAGNWDFQRVKICCEHVLEKAKPTLLMFATILAWDKMLWEAKQVYGVACLQSQGCHGFLLLTTSVVELVGGLNEATWLGSPQTSRASPIVCTLILLHCWFWEHFNEHVTWQCEMLINTRLSILMKLVKEELSTTTELEKDTARNLCWSNIWF